MPRQPVDLATIFQNSPIILDGGFGTELERRRIPTPAPLWSAFALQQSPDVVTNIHREYVAAGAQILVANTFRTNPRTLRLANRQADGPKLNRAAVALARDAADKSRQPVTIAASVAPVEDCYSPERVPNSEILLAEHREMIGWLTEAKPDLIWIETMNTACEAHLAALAAHDADLPFCISFVMREDGYLLGGDSLDDAIEQITPLEPLAFGINCIPPKGVTKILPQLRKLTSVKIAVYAHIDNPQPTPGWSFSEVGVSPEQYAAYVKTWRDMGADIIGGCCGTTPDHIRAVANAFAR